MATQETNTDEALQARIQAWGAKAGYTLTDPGDRTHIRPGRRRPQGLPPRPTIPARPQSADARASAAARLTIDVSDPNAIVMKKAFKGGAAKKTCLVEIGGKTLVLKGGSEDSSEHVLASEFIAKLNLPGVRVPATRMLTEKERLALISAFENKGGHAEELAASLQQRNVDGTFSGQLSELAQGAAPDHLFMSDSARATLDAAIKFREDLLSRALSKDEAWAKAYAEFAQLAKGSSISVNDVTQRSNAVTSADRALVLDWMRKNCVSPKTKQMPDLLEEIESGQLAQGLAKLKTVAEEQRKGREALTTFASSAEGIQAFAGMASADLVSGMHDRIVGDYNGGNFLFDAASNELVCVDNAKTPERALSAPDVVAWKVFVGELCAESSTLEDAIYQKVYGTNDNSCLGLPANYVTFDAQQEAAAKDTIRETLTQVVATIEADPTQSKSARDRAAFLKARMALDDIVRSATTLPEPPQPPAKAGVANKLARAGKSFFTSNKKDKRVDTQRIKDQLRGGELTAAQAREQLNALKEGSPSLSSDRRSLKIEYLASVAECCETLRAAGTELKQFLAKAPAGILHESSVKGIRESLHALEQSWRTALAGDKKMLAQFDRAWDAFTAEIRTV
jgi:hypothetical protein